MSDTRVEKMLDLCEQAAGAAKARVRARIVAWLRANWDDEKYRYEGNDYEDGCENCGLEMIERLADELDPGGPKGHAKK
jgi:hypothetical protein